MVKTITFDFVIHKKVRIIYLAALFAVVFSTFFLIKLLPISPIYMTSVFAVFLAVTAYSYKKIPIKQVGVYIPVFLMSVWFVIAAIFTPQEYGYERHFKDPIVFMFFAMYYIIVDVLLYQVNEKEIKKIVNWYFIFNFLFFLVELYFRVRYGNNTEFGGWISAAEEAGAGIELLFYKYKFYSIMGVDSNFSALVIFPVLSVAVFLCKENLYKKSNGLLWSVLFFALLCFTFSRAIIISFFMLLAFLFFYYKRNKVIKFLSIFIVSALSVIVLNYLMKDFSLLTKFQIFHDLSKYFETISISQVFFGNGTMSSENILSFYAHNLPALFIVEYGIVSLLLFLFAFAIISVDVGKHSFYVFPFLLGAAISYVSPYVPFIWTAFALIKHLDRLHGYKSVVKEKGHKLFSCKQEEKI